jgi:hypothetical protein
MVPFSTAGEFKVALVRVTIFAPWQQQQQQQQQSCRTSHNSAREKQFY